MRQHTYTLAFQRVGFALTLAFVLSWLVLPWHVSVIRAADQIWYVNHAATGTNDGTSWENAFTTLQLALSAAQTGDEIWVAKGIYLPTTDTSDKAASFVIQDDIALYGGFIGNEADLSQRNWELNKTILSGDIDQNDNAVDGVITDLSQIEGDNSYHVLLINGVSAKAIIDGFVITGGVAMFRDLPEHTIGGGIYNINSNIRLTNLLLSGNVAMLYGGAVVNQSSNPSFSNVHFVQNFGLLGGGLINVDSNPTLVDVTFSDNFALYGGAIANTESDVTITNVSFIANQATVGGAINSSDKVNLTITNAIFADNSAIEDGGAISSADHTDLTLTNAKFSNNSAGLEGGAFFNQTSSAVLSNVLFAGNFAGTNGGAIVDIGSTIDLTNVTIAGNSSNALYLEDSTTNIQNSILWENSSSPIEMVGATSISIAYSLAQHCNPSGVWNSACGTDGGNNLVDADPLFASPIVAADAPTSTGDFHVLPGSPAIDAGSSSLNSSATDLDGKPRHLGLEIDLGAYEFAYRLQTYVVGKGEITYTPAGEWIDPVAHSVVTFTATAQAGWTFAGWSGDLSGSITPTSLTINSSKVITATFTNDAPIAHAGADQTVVAGSTVTLNGSASFDADPTQTLSYAWAQTSGTPVTLTGANTAQPTFTAPSAAGTLIFSVVVTDSMGLASTADSVSISVVAQAGPSTYQLHLPITQHSPIELRANLIVTSLSADQDGLRVEIKNIGEAASQLAFWVDVYVNPRQAPENNTMWKDIAPYGVVWAITQSLAPGESMVLTLDNPKFAPEHSFVQYQAGDQLYAIVDSYNGSTNYGAVNETNEHDNRLGPVTALANLKLANPASSKIDYTQLPAR